jgi:hypothetical protein
MQSIIIIICFYIILILIYPKYNHTETFVYASDDNKEKIETLKNVVDNLYKLRNYLIELYPDNSYVKQLKNNLDPYRTSIYETDPSSSYSSYTVNKGSELHMCLRSKITGKLHDVNLLTYVGIHEMAHMANPEVGHGPLFQKIFNFFIETAINKKLYDPRFLNASVEFCGKPVFLHRNINYKEYNN